jgi:acetyltransferase-like isoleucine patch superfamily enzyme
VFKFKSNYWKLFMKLNGVKYGKNVNLYGIPVIYSFGSSEINIGDNTDIKSSFLSSLLGLYQRTIIVARNNAKITIGKSVGIAAATIYAMKEIIIGDHAMIGPNTKIFDTDFHPVDPKARLSADDSRISVKPVVIGSNVFIGCNCIILKGSRIGDNSVVGAGSVVSGQFPDNVLIAGNPARVIKEI